MLPGDADRAVACALVVLFGVAVAQTTGTLPEFSGDVIGFPSPGAALAALRARPDVSFKEADGWLVAVDQKNQTVWSFPPQSHPAYPSAIKRYVVQQGGKFYLASRIMCGGTKVVCDQLELDFEKLNAQAPNTLKH